MTKKIIYKQQNNKLAVMSWAPHLTAAEAVNELPEGTQYIIVSDTAMPPAEDLADFFEAMRVDFNSGLITFDITDARTITKARLRKERLSKLEANDICLRDAMLENDAEKIAAAIVERNRLRDITLLVDAKNTLGELRNLHP